MGPLSLLSNSLLTVHFCLSEWEIQQLLYKHSQNAYLLHTHISPAQLEKTLCHRDTLWAKNLSPNDIKIFFTFLLLKELQSKLCTGMFELSVLFDVCESIHPSWENKSMDHYEF